MRLCIPAVGRTMGSKVDRAFGRAAYFIFVDLETMRFMSMRNLRLLPGQGAGPVAANMIALVGTHCLLTEFVGANAFSALQAAQIKVYEGVSPRDTVGEAVQKFRQGLYKPATEGIGRRWCGPAPVEEPVACGRVA